MEILVLDRRNGVICNEYVDSTSLINFFTRTGNLRRFQVVVRKGEKALYIDQIDIVSLPGKINDFNTNTKS